MKRILTILAVGVAFTGCGEQFQGNFTGTAVSSGANCVGESGTRYEVEVSAVVSGNNIRMNIIGLNVAGSSNDVNYNLDASDSVFERQIINVPKDNSLRNNREFFTTEPRTERAVLDDDLLFNIQQEDIDFDDVDRRSFDLVEYSGFLSNDRRVISSFSFRRQALFPTDSGGVKDCEFAIRANSDLVLDRQ